MDICQVCGAPANVIVSDVDDAGHIVVGTYCRAHSFIEQPTPFSFSRDDSLQSIDRVLAFIRDRNAVPSRSDMIRLGVGENVICAVAGAPGGVSAIKAALEELATLFGSEDGDDSN